MREFRTLVKHRKSLGHMPKVLREEANASFETPPSHKSEEGPSRPREKARRQSKLNTKPKTAPSKHPAARQAHVPATLNRRRRMLASRTSNTST